jgi:hypothetical protein
MKSRWAALSPEMSNHPPSARVEQGYSTLYTQPSSSNTIPPSRHRKYRAKNVVVIAGDNALSKHTLSKLVESSPSSSRPRHGRGEGVQVSSHGLPAVRSAVQSATFDLGKRDQVGSAAQLTDPEFLNNLMLSKRLRTIRLQKNISIIDLAKKSRVPLQVLADYERGWQQPDQTMLQRLALALDVHITELLSIATR